MGLSSAAPPSLPPLSDADRAHVARDAEIAALLKDVKGLLQLAQPQTVHQVVIFNTKPYTLKRQGRLYTYVWLPQSVILTIDYPGMQAATLTFAAGWNDFDYAEGTTFTAATPIVGLLRLTNAPMTAPQAGGGGLTSAVNVFNGVNEWNIDGSGDGHVIVDSGTITATIQQANQVDAGNSSTTPLAANGVFTGAQTSALPWSSITISVKSDQASAANGLSIQQSQDGVNWDLQDNFSVAANTEFQTTVDLVMQFYKVIYTNGTTIQTAFRLQTVKQLQEAPLPRTLTSLGNLKSGLVEINGQTPQVETVGAAMAGALVTEDTIRRLILAGKCFAATTGKVTAPGAATLGFQLFNPANSGKNILIYSIKLDNAAAGFDDLRQTTADVSSIAGWANTAIVPVNREGGGGASIATIGYSNVNLTGGLLGSSTDTPNSTGNVPTELLTNGDCIFLPASASINGFALYLNLTGTTVWSVGVKYLEWS
jgi:hypothetical protein